MTNIFWKMLSTWTGFDDLDEDTGFAEKLLRALRIRRPAKARVDRRRCPQHMVHRT